MSSRFVGILLVVAALAFCGFEILHSTGIVGVTRKPNHEFVVPGCFCHGSDPSPFVHVVIIGPDSLGLGETATYTVQVTKDSNIAAGFNVATFVGALSIGDSLDQQIIQYDGSDELTHTFPKLANANDTIAWVFRYQAPEVAMFDTIYGVGNSVDTSIDPDGDYWNFSDDLVVRVGNPVGVIADASPIPAHFELLQNYPNPFNPSTHILYRLPQSSHVRLSVYDVTGREISRLIDRRERGGEHDVVFDAKGLASGIYIYRLVTDDFVQARKMVFMK